MSRILFPLSVVVASLLLSACSTTVDQRIAKNDDLFFALDLETQQKLRDGIVEPGYTPEMVIIAMGEPSERAILVTEAGEVETWYYTRKKPGFSIGFGTGSYGRSGGVSTGVSVGQGPKTEYRAIIEFDASGEVVRVERPIR